MKYDNMADLRIELNKIDSSLLSLFKDRFNLIHEASIIKKNTNENSTWFFLNKQAAFVEIVALCNDADESSLGPIKVILEADDIESVIELLV